MDAYKWAGKRARLKWRSAEVDEDEEGHGRGRHGLGREGASSDWLWISRCLAMLVAVVLVTGLATKMPVAQGQQIQQDAWLSDIVMGGPASMTFIYGPEYVEVEVEMVRGVQLAFAAANARVGYDRMGVLARRNLTARFEDDGAEPDRTINITTSLLALPEDQFFGFLVGPDAESCQESFALVNATGLEIPFIGPWSAAPYFRDPFRRWIFNTLPRSFPSIIYAIIKFLANTKLISRVALFYPRADLVSGSDIRKITSDALGAFGLRLVSYYQLPDFSYVPARIDLAVANISAGNPQAVILINDQTNTFALVRALKEKLTDVSYIIDGAITIGAETVLNGTYRDEVYQTFPVPLLSDNSERVVREFHEDRLRYDPEWVDPGEVGALEGYIEGRWLVSVFEGMREPLTRASFIDAVYATPIHTVGDIVMGPHYQDCTATGCQACCNAGSRKLYLVQFPNGTLEYAEDGALEWQSCFPQPSDVKFPFKFGQSTALSGHYNATGTAVRDGILAAFAESNQAGSLNERDAVLISYDDHSQPFNYTASNYEQLTTLDAVLALVGLPGYDSVDIALHMQGNNSADGNSGSDISDIPIIGFTSGSPLLRAQFDRRAVSITPSSYEEMAGALHYFVDIEPKFTRVAIFYENTHSGRLTNEGLIKALRLRNLVPWASVPAGSSLEPARGAQLLFVYGSKTSDLPGQALSLFGSSIELCVLAAQNPDLVAGALAAQVGGSGKRQQTVLSNVYFTQALPNPNPDLAAPQVVLPNATGIVADYRAAMTALHDRSDSAATLTYASFNGYVTGRFLLALISTINGRVTSDSLLRSVYTSGVIDLSGLRLGLYYDRCNTTQLPCCNTGTRSIYVVQPSIDTASVLPAVLWRTVHAFTYFNCTISFDPESTSSSNGLSTAVGAVIGVVAGVGGFLLLVLLVALVLGAILVRLSRRRRRDEWEIGFEELELGSLLGYGGYGEVYKGRWRGTEVAIKTINTSREVTREMRASFAAEARIMSRLRHPNVVLFMAASTKPPTMCIVMEFMSLGSLFDLLHNELVTSIPLALKVKLAYQAAKGMAFLHSSGIVHRDLKSLNLLLDHKWNVKVSDFGLTLFKDSIMKKENNQRVVGSIPWMAPELLDGSTSRNHAMCDVYSYGVVLWELLFRAQPYEGLAPPQIAVAVLRNDIRPFVPVGEYSPAEESYLALTNRCWHRDPAMRPMFMDIIKDLQAILESEGVHISNSSSSAESSGPAGHASGAYDRDDARRSVDSLRRRRSPVNSASASASGSVVTWGKEGGIPRQAAHSPGQMASSASYSHTTSDEEFGMRPQLPIADVSIAVCDLVGCDEAWAADPVATPKAITAYADLVRQIAEDADGGGGTIFSDSSLNSGGTFFLAFAQMGAAATFALALQKDVTAHKWPTTIRVLSRVSLHHCASAGVVRERLRLRYKLSDYEPAVEANTLCRPGGVLCTPAFRNRAMQLCAGFVFARRRDGDGFYLLRHDADDHSDDDSNSELASDSSTDDDKGGGGDEPSLDDEWRALGLESQAICSSNRCPWIVDRARLSLDRQIGEGNYGKVLAGIYEGHKDQGPFQLSVAVKRLFQKRLTDKALLQVRKEAAILSGLDHPNIVRLIGLCIADTELLLVMERVSHGCLRTLLSSSTSLRWRQRLLLLRNAALGLSYLHSKGLIHRDIKSSNLLVADSHHTEVKVGDFGFATVKQDIGTQTRCGTPSWTAPEIISGDPYTEKADIYSFGIVMWEVLTRKVPFADKNMMTVAMDVLLGNRPAVPADCPPEYARVMTRCWRRKPRKRPTAEDLVHFFNGQLEDIAV